MKKFAFLLLVLALLPALSARAEEVAVFKFRIGSDKTLRQVVIGLDEAAAPQTVENFEKLVRKKFYKGLKVHRIIPRSLVQMGDPLSRGHDLSQLGTGGPGYTLPPEIHERHTLGAVAMARLADPLNPSRRSSGSQFYICLKPMPNLDGQYTVFGHVLEGMDVLQTMSAQESDTNDNPTEPIVIKAVKLEQR